MYDFLPAVLDIRGDPGGPDLSSVDLLFKRVLFSMSLKFYTKLSFLLLSSDVLSLILTPRLARWLSCWLCFSMVLFRMINFSFYIICLLKSSSFFSSRMACSRFSHDFLSISSTLGVTICFTFFAGRLLRRFQN